MTAKPLGTLTFDDVNRANSARCKKWHPGFPDDEDWTIADWSNAMCGEAGEAANVVKKIRRQGPNDPPLRQLYEDLGKELADIYLYLNLLALKAGIDLPLAIVRKFNEVSERQGFPDRIDTVPC